MRETALPEGAPYGAPWSLHCDRCGFETKRDVILTGCPHCEGQPRSVLRMVFAPEAPVRPLRGRPTARGLLRFRDLLPFGHRPDFTSLGEGGTPLIHSRVIGPRLGLDQLYFKNETVNPTSSFKDRYVAVSVSAARACGYAGVVVSSTGNLGVSVAAYAAAAGLTCVLIAPTTTPAGILQESLLYGARVVCTDHATRRELFEFLADRPDWFPVGLLMPRRHQNPFGVEAYRTIAYELIEELEQPPDAVLFPCARGNNLYGAWKGFVEARDWGWSKTVPRGIACQPAGANSLEVSLAAGSRNAIELPPLESIAASVSESVASDYALEAIRASGGTATSIDDSSIRHAVIELGREGIAAEPSSAVPIACLEKLLRTGKLARSERIVCVITGSGAKWPTERKDWKREIVHFNGGPGKFAALAATLAADKSEGRPKGA
jgi:threonine synthase